MNDEPQSASLRFTAWIAETIRSLGILPDGAVFDERNKDLEKHIREKLARLNIACAVSLPALQQADEDDADAYRIEVLVAIERNTALSGIDSYWVAERILSALKGRQFEDSAGDWVFHRVNVSRLTHGSGASRALHTLTVSANINI